MLRTMLTFAILLPLGACDRAPDESAQTIPLQRRASSLPQALAQSPDTTEAVWAVDEGGQAIDFGTPGDDPLMSLVCRLDGDVPQLSVIRHAAAKPGEKAIFPVIGNGMRSRFMVDAVLEEGEWMWEGTLPAEDPQLEVFTGPRSLTATLPGQGLLEIDGSRIPGEFVSWCRKGGEVIDAQVAEEETEEG